MSETLPLFPLGTVLFPGLLLPLHIFEDRYRQLVRDLADQPEPRQFGVIAIRHGRETGVDGIQALHEIGCTATLRQVKPLEDGRYDVVTVGTQRFRLAGLDDSKPYLQGQVDLLAEETGDEAAAAQGVRVVRDGFRAYLSALAERGVTQISAPELPEDPARRPQRDRAHHVRRACLVALGRIGPHDVFERDELDRPAAMQ